MSHFEDKWSSPLVELNRFQLAKSGVYCANDESEFAYSDGQHVEQQLEAILSQAKNLDSNSTELEEQIIDWPTEYHLSSARANLIRPLDLAGVNRVLELGCGCGAISRYLGEQAHIHVDSVEGSHIRASLAALRCRDQSNVVVSQGNFNEMEFPENHYDLVLFVGVTEYAGRFSDKQSDQEALQELLRLAHRVTKKDGVALIAIENRLGLKYLMGACEDHYGQPKVGLDDYPESTGIRTYSYDQWQLQLAASPFAHSHFMYPFPDYKVPNLVINSSASLSSDALAEVVSRDYLQPFAGQKSEASLWSGVLQSNTLHHFSNSYLILLSDNASSLSKMASFEISHFDVKSYDWQGSERAKSSKKRLQEMNAALVQMSEHASNLEHKVSLLENSKGGRILAWLRRVIKRDAQH